MTDNIAGLFPKGWMFELGCGRICCYLRFLSILQAADDGGRRRLREVQHSFGVVNEVGKFCDFDLGRQHVSRFEEFG